MSLDHTMHQERKKNVKQTLKTFTFFFFDEK